MVKLRLGIIVDYSADFHDAVPEVQEYERIGVDLVGIPEAYSFDAVSRLGYLAAVTSTITLAASILPLYSRTPTLLAMTAAGLDDVSQGRFELGLGSSGAQVIEGFHGVPFTAPLGRIRETVDICRAVWRRERVEHSGRYYQVPLPETEGTGLGKALRLINTPVRAAIPIAIAALTPKGVAQAAEIADGWIPLFFYPERASLAWGDALERGSARRSSDLSDLDVVAQAPLFVGDSTDEALDAYRRRLALYIGGMGARGANFYNDLAARYGYGDEAALVQELYLTGRPREAADAVPDELARATSLIGTESEVQARLAAYFSAGATTISVEAVASSRSDRFESVEALRSMF